jgi:fatty-acyl-CoA synthase
MPKETAETMTEDGWLKTGDIGYFNEFDEICITGRRKEMIIRSGENISPREIEKAIIESGVTKQVKVVGVPNVYTQEEIAACIVVEEGQDFDPQALLQFLKARLSYFKIPKYIFTFRELPMTASGKVRLGALKEIAAENAADADGLKAIGTTGNYAKAIY